MLKKKNSKLTIDNSKVDPEGLRVKYDSLAAYGRTVITFRFTVLGFYLTAVGLVLAGTPTFGKYLILVVITIALYIIELRNRFLKNELGAQAKQIEKIWGYSENKSDDYNLDPVFILGFQIKNREDDYTKSGITHSTALDILYFSICLYALVNMVILSIPFIKSLFLSLIGT